MDRNQIAKQIVGQIVAQMETCGADWCRPWTATAADGAHANVTSRKAYRGLNVFLTGIAAHDAGYTSNLWGTYQQWADKKAQVRKGEKSTKIVFWKKMDGKPTTDTDGNETKTSGGMMCRLYSVFNAAQVDGFDAPVKDAPVKEALPLVERADSFIAATGATIRHGGSRAYYSPMHDFIGMPHLSAFADTVSYYGTALHELTHWTGHKSRCDRDFSGKFGTDAYAFEELVAELGAAILCGTLGVSVSPREDHAKYLNNWMRVLENNPTSIFTAFSKSQASVDYLYGLQCNSAAIAA